MNANVTAIRTRAEAALAEQFAAVRASLPGTERVAALRAQNFESFVRSGLPNRRVEAWHFTDLRAALREAFAPGDATPHLPAPEPQAGLAPGAIRLVLVDGAFRSDLSSLDGLAPGLRVRSLAEALDEADEAFLDALTPLGLGDDPAVALNAAFMAGGLVLDVAAGAQIDRLIELDWTNSTAGPRAVFARSLVRLGAGARLTLVETGAGGSSPRQVNSALVVALADGARLDHVCASPAPPGSSLQIETFLVSLGARARLTSTGLICGAPFLRRQTHVHFQGPHAEVALAGLSLLRGSQHADNTLLVTHVAPHCKSRELFRHVIDEAATGVFQGKIVVAPGAQKTDGKMSSRAILLSDDAAMDNKPELEIFADDVVCGHGATCGELDHDLLFYVMSRGLPRAQAEALLLEAFAGEALDSVANKAVREALRERMRAWLEERGP